MPPPRSARQLNEDWQSALEHFRAEGFQIELTSVIAPVQLEGHLPNGKRFYFRERGGLCRLEIGDDAVGSPERSVTEELPAQGLMPEEAEPILRRQFHAAAS
jgi:hypothetical protein